MTLAPLVDPARLAEFDGGDPALFVTAAEAEVRRYCGWHIAPAVTVDAGRYRCGERGLIMLPSLYVTAVESVAVDGRVLNDTEYDWEACGFIHRRVPSWPLDPYATVMWTHGYAECPPDVAVVVLELASRAMEMPASVADTVMAGPFRLTLAGNAGLNLSRDQRERLGSYRIQGVH